MGKPASRSLLHYQMGQEVLYLLMTIGVTTSVILFVYARSLVIENNCLLSELEKLRPDYYVALNDHQRCKSKLPDKPAHDQPPIITLSEVEEYYFTSRSVELGDVLRDKLIGPVVRKILDLSEQYNATVVEVIGHTDEVPLRDPQDSTFDNELMLYLNGSLSGELDFSDNVGLGMARAAAVVRILRGDKRLEGFEILPLSAGQTTTVEDTLSPGQADPKDDETRRRIEIRIRQKNSVP